VAGKRPPFLEAASMILAARKIDAIFMAEEPSTVVAGLESNAEVGESDM
jgi:hypothetical protein